MKAIKLDNGKMYTTVNERLKELVRRVKDKEIKAYSLQTTEHRYLTPLESWVVKVQLEIVSLQEEISTYSGASSYKISDDEWGRSALEVAETSARGRAMAAAGIGIDSEGASVDEVITKTDIPSTQLSDKVAESVKTTDSTAARTLSDAMDILEGIEDAGVTPKQYGAVFRNMKTGYKTLNLFLTDAPIVEINEFLEKLK